ncbi:enoyl-CoA hydratase [Sporolactobacillus sp. THM7-4]|nr:enoyl-CoA hydratase [Sporolactobacillus sp. THM7-4]
MNLQSVEIKTEEHIACLTINRPEALNSLNTKVLKELEEAYNSIARQADIRVVIMTGSGEKAFVAGADIGEMKDKTPDEARTFSQYGQRLMRKIEQLPQPVIAAVNGFALGGGCELALACDMRLASRNARFGQPEVTLGIIPGFGGSQRLPRLVGAGIAKELLLTGAIITADRAREIGLVNEVYETRTELDEKAFQLAKTIAKRAPLAVRQTKQLVNRGLEISLDQALNDEVEQFSRLFETDDQKEGMEAFLKKRRPKFSGK